MAALVKGQCTFAHLFETHSILVTAIKAALNFSSLESKYKESQSSNHKCHNS